MPAHGTGSHGQRDPAHIYHLANFARLRILSNTNIIFYTDASGTLQQAPMVCSASVAVSWLADRLHIEQHMGRPPTAISASCLTP